SGCQSGGGGRVPHVVFSGERKLKISPRFALVQNGPTCPRRLRADIGNPPSAFRIGIGTVALHAAKRTGNAALHAFSRIECDQITSARNQVYQPLKGSLYSVEVFVNVCVIELD